MPVGLQVPEHDLSAVGGGLLIVGRQAGRQEEMAPVTAFSMMPLIRDSIVLPLSSPP